METRNPVEGYFGSEFPAICYHCGVMAAWSRKPLNLKNCSFWKSDPLLYNFPNFREIWPTENWWNRALLTWQKTKTKSRLALQLQIALKICQDQPPTMHSKSSRFHTNRFTFFGVIAERVNTDKTRRKVNPIFG